MSNLVSFNYDFDRCKLKFSLLSLYLTLFIMLDKTK